jgi:hypothetical protein
MSLDLGGFTTVFGSLPLLFEISEYATQTGRSLLPWGLIHHADRGVVRMDEQLKNDMIRLKRLLRF